MAETTLKIVIPMAGFGTRLRPLTWSKPKQLVSIAGKTVLAHLLDTFRTLPESNKVEYIFIIGYLGEQVRAYMAKCYPELQVSYVVQEEMRGQSHAISLAKQYLGGPMIMVFTDTLVETDLAFLEHDRQEAIAWVKEVPDPRRFGVASLGHDGWVTRLVEKPQDMDNNLVVVGFYYFPSSEDLLAAIDEQMRRGIQLKGEYFLADAINIMLERGLKMRTHPVGFWLDAGLPQDVLSTNRYLLEHGRDNSVEAACRQGVMVVPPVYIHPTAEIERSVIGPYTAIGQGCHVENSVIRDSILEEGAQVVDAILESSLIGCQASVRGRAGVIIAGDLTAIQV